MPKAKDWRTAHRCPVGKGGRIKAQAQKTGVCFQIERVKRNGTKGFITTLHNRATGRRAGYSAKAAEGKACPLTQDPFRADIRPKGSAIRGRLRPAPVGAEEVHPAGSCQEEEAREEEGGQEARGQETWITPSTSISTTLSSIRKRTSAGVWSEFTPGRMPGSS